MTVFRSIEPTQEPFPLTPDSRDRRRWAFNLNAIKRNSATTLDELGKILQNAGVGTINTDIFYTGDAQVPEGAGPYIVINLTGGFFPERLHNDAGGQPTWTRPSAQIVVIAATSAAAETKIRAAYNALAAVTNQDVTP